MTPLADSQNGNLIKTAIAMHVDGEENTMNELKIFEHPDFGKIRTVTIDDEPYLVGKDVAEVLGYSNTKDALAVHVDDDDKRILQRSEITTLENHIPKSVLPVNFTSADIPNHGLTIINESGLYSLILGSKLPGAKKFKRWVTSEVLPSIRVLEEFWYGNIEPTEYDTSSKEYKKLQELICRNEEKLKATMTDEQKELFEKYTDCVREYQTITDCLIFQNSFRLGARMMLEVMEE